MSTAIDHLYEPMRPLVTNIITTANALLQMRKQDSLRVIVHETHRTWARQAELYAQGRTAPGPIRTNAKPEESAHCIVTKDGLPAAMAVDLWVVAGTGASQAILRDAHPAWAVVPAAAYIVAGDKLAMGAAFASIKGGDWPHLEWSGWRSLVSNGHLVAA